MRAFHTLGVVMIVASCKLHGSSADGGSPSIISQLASLVSFEGEIDMQMTTSLVASSSMKTTFAIKGDKMRTETPGLASFVSITDGGAKKSWMLDTTTHTYTEIDLAASPKSPPTTTKPKPAATVTKTGRSDKVAGYACDVYEVDDPTGTTAFGHVELCMASGLAMMALGLGGPFSAFSKGDDAWSEVLSHGFPLRIVMRDPHGAPMMKMEATRIEKKSLPDSEFTVPAGYKKTI